MATGGWPYWKVWQFSTRYRVCRQVLVALACVQSLLKHSIARASLHSLRESTLENKNLVRAAVILSSMCS